MTTYYDIVGVSKSKISLASCILFEICLFSTMEGISGYNSKLEFNVVSDSVLS